MRAEGRKIKRETERMSRERKDGSHPLEDTSLFEFLPCARSQGVDERRVGKRDRFPSSLVDPFI